MKSTILKIRRIKVKTGMQLGAKQAIWLLKFFRSSLKKIKREKQKFDFPDWIGEEVSFDSRYYNSWLSLNPFSKW